MKVLESTPMKLLLGTNNSWSSFPNHYFILNSQVDPPSGWRQWPQGQWQGSQSTVYIANSAVWVKQGKSLALMLLPHGSPQWQENFLKTKGCVCPLVVRRLSQQQDIEGFMPISSWPRVWPWTALLISKPAWFIHGRSCTRRKRKNSRLVYFR